MSADAKLEILQHALGLDQYGQGRSLRDYYNTEAGDPDIDALVADGLMVDCGYVKWMRMNCYRVTRSGRSYVSEHSPKPPPAAKLTRSQKRYLAFLDADNGLTFAEYIGASKSTRTMMY